jgi:nicotinamidase-related amidase
MATVREGNRSALMVVDMQVGVMVDAWDAERVAGNVALAVTRARDQGAPVVWVQHVSDRLPEGSAPWQWVPELLPRQSETSILKRFNSAFEQTALDATFEHLGISHIVLAGAATNWCIRATAYAALDRGYDLTLIEDGHTTGDLELPGGRRVEARQVIDDLNTAMTWLQYPGRRNGTAAAATVDFGGPGGAGEGSA